MNLQDYKQEYEKLENKKNLSGKEALEAVKKNGDALRYVTEQTEEICLEAVKGNGYALQYISEQTEEICLEAVKEDGCALKYVVEQTEEICLEAVKQDGYALRYVNSKFFEGVESKSLSGKEVEVIVDGKTYEAVIK